MGSFVLVSYVYKSSFNEPTKAAHQSSGVDHPECGEGAPQLPRLNGSLAETSRVASGAPPGSNSGWVTELGAGVREM